MPKLMTMGSLSLNGKSFYFNKGTAKNGATFLALHGKTGDRREQVVVFDNQLDAFVLELNRVYRNMRNLEVPVPGAVATPCEECHRLENGEWGPILGTGDPDETCPACGRQL
jgi:hypothetical protein